MVNCLCVSTCGQAFASGRKLLDHEKICKTCCGVVKYRCGTCGKLFSSIRYLKLHDVVHSDVRKFNCGLCDKSFKRSNHLKDHELLIHSDVRNFKCYICDGAFKRKSDYIRHEEEHLGIKNFKCMKCNKGFTRYFNALSHEKICRKNDAAVSGCCSDDGKLDLVDTEVSDDEHMYVKDTDRYTYL